MHDFPTAQQSRAVTASIQSEKNQKILADIKKQIESATQRGANDVTLTRCPEAVQAFLREKGYMVQYHNNKTAAQLDQRELSEYWVVSW